MPLTPSVPNPNKRSKWLLGKPLCSSACRLSPYNIMLRLPSSKSPSRLCHHLTHSSRSLFPCLELFLPPARKINQCLTLPVNARELLLLEGRNGLPVPHPRPPALPHLSCHQLKSHICPFSLCPTGFPRPSQLGSPSSSTPAQAISGQTHLKRTDGHNTSPSSLVGAGHQIPEQETSCL